MYATKTLIKTFLLSFCILSAALAAPVKISILQLVDHPALNATYQGLRDELKILGYREGDTLTLDFQSAQGNPALATQIAQKFVSNKPDLIVAIATTAAQAAMNATKEAGIPVVFASVTDPVAAKLVTNLQAPEGRVTGVSNYVEVEKQFALFKSKQPALKKLGIVYNPGEANSTALIEIMQRAAKKLGWELVLAAAPKSSDVFGATQSLCGKVDAVFVNNDNTALSAFKSVVRAAKACNIPAYVSDIDMADQGAAAALGCDQLFLGRQVGRMVDEILKNPGTLLPAVQFPEKTLEYSAS